MGGACNTHGGDNKYKILVERPERKGPTNKLHGAESLLRN